MAVLFPEIEPYDHGLLGVGDGQRIYWEACGNPQGKPVVALHGRPGSVISAGMRRFFNPAAYHIIMFDQHGCGQSAPHASQPVIVCGAGHSTGDPGMAEALVAAAERFAV
jgi:proline iminopeptidase